MAFSKSDKAKVIDGLIKARRAAQRTELELRFQGKSEEAERVWEATTRLGTEIDFLVGRAMEEWTADAAGVISRLTQKQAALDAAARDIKKKMGVAAKVVAAIGVIDDLVSLAKTVAAAL